MFGMIEWTFPHFLLYLIADLAIETQKRFWHQNEFWKNGIVRRERNIKKEKENDGQTDRKKETLKQTNRQREKQNEQKTDDKERQTKKKNSAKKMRNNEYKIQVCRNTDIQIKRMMHNFANLVLLKDL